MQNLEQQIANVIQDNLRGLGFDLVKVTLKGLNHQVLEVLIDRLDGKKVNTIDCRNASRSISVLLDVENIINNQYSLEVSSVGIERPLVKLEDYNRFLGKEVIVILKRLPSGQTRYQGKIVKVENSKIYLSNNGQGVVLSLNMIKKASLALTDEMFRDLINKPTCTI